NRRLPQGQTAPRRRRGLLLRRAHVGRSRRVGRAVDEEEVLAVGAALFGLAVGVGFVPELEDALFDRIGVVSVRDRLEPAHGSPIRAGTKGASVVQTDLQEMESTRRRV